MASSDYEDSKRKTPPGFTIHESTTPETTPKANPNFQVSLRSLYSLLPSCHPLIDHEPYDQVPSVHMSANRQADSSPMALMTSKMANLQCNFSSTSGNCDDSDNVLSNV